MLEDYFVPLAQDFIWDKIGYFEYIKGMSVCDLIYKLKGVNYHGHG